MTSEPDPPEPADSSANRPPDTSDAPDPGAPDMATAFDANLDATGDPMAALERILRRPGRGRGSTELRGEVIGGCRLVRLLGVGGCGATYAAFDANDDPVAVKVVGPLDIRAHQRFLTECAILQQLKHTAIVRYRAHGLTDDALGYLVMELVEGADLHTVLECAEAGDWAPPVVDALTEGCTTPLRESAVFRRRVLRMLATIAEALHEAHGHDIVHRDVKPSNILVDRRLQPRLIDFGLGLELMRHRSLTRSGLAVGTLAYMAPEQWKAGERVTATADVFSLGLVAYRCLTGRELRGDLARLTATPRRAGFFEKDSVAHLPRAEQAVLYKALQADPRRRYATALEMARDLRAVLANEPVSASVPRGLGRLASRSIGHGWTMAAGAAVVAVLGLITWAVASWLDRSLTLQNPLRRYWWTGEAPEGEGLVQLDWFQDLADGTLLIDDQKVALSELTGWRGHLLDVGLHRLEWKNGRDEDFAETIDVRHGYQRITFLNTPIHWVLSEVDGVGAGPHVHIDCGEVIPFAGDTTILVDDEDFAPDTSWAILNSREEYKLEGRIGALVEIQTVKLKHSQLNPVWLLGGAAADPGAWDYRRTLGSVFAPIPDDIEIIETGNAALFLNHDQDKYAHGEAPNASSKGDVAGHIHSNSGATSPLPGLEGSVTIAVDFAKPVAAVLCRTNHSRDHVVLEYRFDDGDWEEVAPDDRPDRSSLAEIDVDGLPGVMRLEVRASFDGEVSAFTEPSDTAFQAYIDMAAKLGVQTTPQRGRTPAFSVVARYVAK